MEHTSLRDGEGAAGAEQAHIALLNIIKSRLQDLAVLDDRCNGAINRKQQPAWATTAASHLPPPFHLLLV